MDTAAVVYSSSGEVKVSVFEAAMQGASMSVAHILYIAAFGREPEGSDLLQAVSEKVKPQLREVVEALGQATPDYTQLSRSVEDSANFKECSACQRWKSASTEQLCRQHFFCSAECLSSKQKATATSATQCPLCPKPRKVVVVRSQRVCAGCRKPFPSDSQEPWRLEAAGGRLSAEDYCSRDCLAAAAEDKTAKCLVCGMYVPPGIGPMHCGKHQLCSDQCTVKYYKGDDPRSHIIEEKLLCYECLPNYLQEMGDFSDIPEIVMLKQKLLWFQTSDALPTEPLKQANCTCCMVAECGDFISAGALIFRNFRTVCIYCSKPLLVAKNTSRDFHLDESSPFLLSCEFRLHGVCSRSCLRARLSSDSTQCPKCVDSTIPDYAIRLALTAANPTIECIRRTPTPHGHCPSGYCLQGCRHEMCSAEVERFLNEANEVMCPVCGNTNPFEVVITTEFFIKKGVLTPEEKRRTVHSK